MRVVPLGLRGRSGKLLILRLTPRGVWRPRLETTRSSRISSRTASWNASLRLGGNSNKLGQFAADDSHRVDERQPVWVLASLQRCFMHQSSYREVRHQ